MSVDFVLDAELRDDKGKGASRRLRRAGKVPAVLYGANKEPKSITLDHINLLHHLEHEAFFSHILTINLGKAKEKVILKDLQRHPSKPVILHLDLQRIKETEKLRVHIPIHFLNEASAPGVKQGGLVGHNITEVEVSCLPKNLPEFLEVDLGNLELNASLHLSDIKLPEGAELVELMHGEGHDQAVVNVHLPRVVKEVDEEAAEAEEAAATGEAEGTPEAEGNE